MNQEDLLAECMKEAMKVEFLHTSEEIKLWAYSLYNAKIWGEECEVINRNLLTLCYMSSGM